MRKLVFLAFFSLAVGLMLASASARKLSLPASPQSEQPPQQASNSVDGTVAFIGHNSFELEVKEGNNKLFLRFVLDEDTQVQGDVQVGSSVAVDYVRMADENVARAVTAELAI